jgi:hypothetical protein
MIEIDEIAITKKDIKLMSKVIPPDTKNIFEGSKKLLSFLFLNNRRNTKKSGRLILSLKPIIL